MSSYPFAHLAHFLNNVKQYVIPTIDVNKQYENALIYLRFILCSYHNEQYRYACM